MQAFLIFINAHMWQFFAVTGISTGVALITDGVSHNDVVSAGVGALLFGVLSAASR